MLLGIVLLAEDHWRRKVFWPGAVLAVLLGVVLVVGAVTVRNVLVGDDLVLITSNLGLNFFVGNNPDARGYYEKPKGMDFDTDLTGSRIAMFLTGRALKPSEVSRFWLQRALAFMKAQPGAFLRLTLNKFLFFWNAYEIPQAENFHFFKKFSPLLRWPLLGFSVLGPLGLLGMALSLGRWRKTYFLLAFVFSLMAATVLFFVLARFRIQVCAVLMVFAAYALVWMWRSIRTGKISHLTAAILALIPMALLVNWPHPLLNSNRDLARAHTYLAKYKWKIQADLPATSRELEQALVLDPHLGETYLHLAKLRLEQGQVDETFNLWRRAVQMDPQVSVAHRNVGNLYIQMGMWEEAIQEYREEVRMSPYSIKAREALSKALEEREKLQGDSLEESELSGPK
jgi:tetratricopeptide (TPR) repeat protein